MSLSETDLLTELQRFCINTDNKHGTLKFIYICNIMKQLELIDNNDLVIQPFNNTKVSLIMSRYELEFTEMKKIGSGSFGKIYLVKHNLDNNNYAIKKINISVVNINSLQKILSEIQILSSLNHSNIVRYFNSWVEPYIKKRIYSKTVLKLEDSLESDSSNNSSTRSLINSDNSLTQQYSNQAFNNLELITYNKLPTTEYKLTFHIQMEYCRGGTLREWLDIRDSVNIKDNIIIFMQLLLGVKYLSENGVIHRDIKPNNIFLENGIIKLGDFGLSTLLYNWSELGSSYGSELYIDRTNYNIQDKRFDIYSLGIILIELYCPFKTYMERYKRLSNIDDTFFKTLSNKYPNISNIITNCLINIDKRVHIDELIIQYQTYIHAQNINIDKHNIKYID